MADLMQALERSRELRRSGRAEQAAQLVVQAVATHEPSSELLNELGAALHGYGPALRAVEEEARTNPGSARLVIAQSTLLEWTGYEQRAERLLEAKSDHNSDVELRVAAAELHTRLGALTTALQILDTVLAERPDHVAAITSKAITLHKLGSTRRAIDTVETGLEIAPDHPALQVAKARLLSDLEEIDEALSTLDKLLSQEPNWVEAITEKASVLGQSGRYYEAREVLDSRLTSLSDDEQLLLELGDLASSHGDYASALSALNTVLSVTPDDVHTIVDKVGVLQAARRFDEAERVLAGGLAAHPDSLRLLMAVGSSAWAREKYDKAVEAFDAVLARAPDDLDAIVAKADVLRAARRFSDAEEVLVHGLSAHSNSFSLKVAMAWHDWYCYRETESLEGFQAVLRDHPDMADAWHGLALSYDWIGRRGAAEAVVRQALARHPSDPNLNAVAADLAFGRLAYQESSRFADLALQGDRKNERAAQFSRRLSRRGVGSMPATTWTRLVRPIRDRLDSGVALFLEQRRPVLRALSDLSGSDECQRADIVYKAERAWRRLATSYGWEGLLRPVMIGAGCILTAGVSAFVAVNASGFSLFALALHIVPTATMLTGFAIFVRLRRPTLGHVVRIVFVWAVLLTPTTILLVRSSDDGSLGHPPLGLASGVEATALSSWIYVVLALLRLISYARWRQNIKVDEAEGLLIASLCEVHYDVTSRTLAKDASSRASIAWQLEEIAQAFERGLARELQTGSPAIDQWVRSRCDGMAAAIRLLKQRALIPQHTTWDDLAEQLTNTAHAVAFDDIDEVAWSEPAPKRPMKNRVAAGFMGIAIAVGPLVGILLLQATPLELEGSRLDWAVVFGMVWLFVSFLVPFDSRLAEKLAAVRTVLTLPTLPADKSSADDKRTA
jgi:tetratricopeptide (TPR) repeat protein